MPTSRSPSSIASLARSLVVALAALAFGPPSAVASEDAALTAAERAAGWTVLDPARDLRAWRGDAFPADGWSVDGGVLRVTGSGPDLVSRGAWGDFELRMQVQVSKGANSGVMYRVDESVGGAPWISGPEFQVLDDAGFGVEPTGGSSFGALYAVVAPGADKTVRPVGEWNDVRIVVADGVVKHWLNDVLLVEAEIASENFRGRVAASKFGEHAEFFAAESGRIALQNYGNDVAFRDLRVRALDEAPAGSIDLLAGDDWRSRFERVSVEGQDRALVWSKDEDGVLRCAGRPVGYLRTRATWEDFVLRVRWRWPEGGDPGNSGVLVRVVGEDRVWPKSVEAQLQSGRAGDFWCIGDFPMTTDPARTNGRNTRHRFANERPIGTWNRYEIVVDGGTVTLVVNDEVLNVATDVEQVPGWIALQSEGAEIHFGEVTVTPIAGE